MAAFGEGRRAAAVTPLGRSVVVVVHGLAAFEPVADRRIERVIGGIAAGEQRVAAGRGDFNRVEQRRVARHLGVDHVVMEHHLPVRQGADRLAVLADIGDLHDAGQQTRIALRKIFRRPGQFAKFAKIPGHADQILLREALAGKDDDEVIEPGPVDGADGVVVGLFAQIEPADFSSDMLAQGNDVEPRPDHYGHGGSSLSGVAARACHSAVAAAWWTALPCSTSPLANAARIFATSSRAEAALNSTATRSRPPSASLMKSMPSA